MGLLLYENFYLIEEYHRKQTMHFFALKRQKTNVISQFLRIQSELTSSLLGFRTKATRVSYKQVSY